MITLASDFLPFYPIDNNSIKSKVSKTPYMKTIRAILAQVPESGFAKAVVNCKCKIICNAFCWKPVANCATSHALIHGSQKFSMLDFTTYWDLLHHSMLGEELSKELSFLL